MNHLELINKRQQEAQKAELTLLLELEKLTSQGAKKEFCLKLGVPWGEYNHLKRKYRFILSPI